MRSTRSGPQGVAAACCVGVAALFLLGASAQAAVFPAGGGSFTGGAEGWQVAGEPACNIGVLGTLGACKGSGGYDATVGNPAGSLKAETEITANLGGLFKSTVDFESPNFTATEGGAATLHLERDLTSADLVDLTPTATFTAMLVDRTAGTRSEVLTGTVTGSETTFTGKDGAATLLAGHSYAILLDTETSSSAASVGLLGSAQLRFDNITLTVGTSASGGGASGGGSGAAGGGTGGSSSGLTDTSLSSLMQSSLVGRAVLKGGRLSVRAKCPAKVGRACRVSLQGLLRKGKIATTRRTAKIGKGKSKVLVLRLKPKAKPKVAKKKRLLFKESVKAGSAKATVYKNLKLIRRS